MRNLIHQLWRAIVVPLCTLNAIQFSAPWNPTRPHCG
jgi:hypothetical protein